MKTSVVAAMALAGIASSANAQFFDVQVSDSNVDLFAGESGLVTVSLFLDRGASSDGFFADFRGWAQYSGQFSASAGSWSAPDESALLDGNPQLNTGDWVGRRPQSETFLPPGAAGGFRGIDISYTLLDGGRTLSAGPNDTIEGLARPSQAGGFQQDTSERLEVFRAVLDLSGLAGQDPQTVTVNFDELASSIFVEDGFNVTRAVQDLMNSQSATINIIPGPASAGLLALGGLAAARRRR